jgi:hypothetical protein
MIAFRAGGRGRSICLGSPRFVSLGGFWLQLPEIGPSCYCAAIRGKDPLASSPECCFAGHMSLYVMAPRFGELLILWRDGLSAERIGSG